MAEHSTATSVRQAGLGVEPARAPVTARALLLGALLIPPNVLWLTTMELVWNSGQPTMLSLFFNAVFTLTVLALGNLLLRRFAPRWAFSSAELVTVYVMVSLGSAVAGHDFLQVLVDELPMATYFSTPVNDYEELFADYIERGVLVGEPRAVWDFWEGDGYLYSARALGPWLGPMATWTVFVLALIGLMLAINLFVWRRWTEQEKLTYPLTEIPFRLTEPGTGIIGRDLMGSRVFGIGFGLAAGIDILNGLATLYRGAPAIHVTGLDIRSHFEAYPWRAMGATWVSVYPFAIGLGYLMPQDFLFSCWFFYWFWKLELIGSWMTGYARMGMPFVQEQTFGAYAGIALFALWAGRRYYAAVIAQVLGGRHPADERHQALPYQVTLSALVLLGALSVLFITQVLRASAGATLVYLAGYLLMSLAITRMRAEFGLPVHDLFTGPFDMMARIGGTRILSRETVLGLGLLYWLERVQRSHPMPNALEGLALGERRGLAAPGTLIALGIAVAVGISAGFWAMLHLGYTHGHATTPADAPYLAMGAFSRPRAWLDLPRDADLNRALALLAGGAFSVGLLLMRQRYVWWPFHPAGYAASSIVFMGLL